MNIAHPFFLNLFLRRPTPHRRYLVLAQSFAVQAMARPEDHEPFIPDTAPPAAPAAAGAAGAAGAGATKARRERRERRAIQQERRRAFRDRHFQERAVEV